MTSGYFYKGKHRAPVDHKLAKGVFTTAATGTLLLTVTPLASASPTLDAIARCESSGNPRANGPVTRAGGHFGLFQFDLPTWRSVGGKGNPRDASVAEQYKRAAMLLDNRGTQPWLASKSCWQGKIGKAKAIPRTETPAKKQTDTPAKSKKSAAKTYTVKRGDTLAEIAAANGTTWRKLAQLNSGIVKNPNIIRVGWELKVS